MICFKGPILFRASSLLVHVAEGELPLHHRVDVDVLGSCIASLGLLHQGLEVAHAEETGDEPVGIEPFEILDRLARCR